MSETYYRVFDSAGTVEATSIESRARRFKESGYPVEVWELKSVRNVSMHNAVNKLYNLDGGPGPSFLNPDACGEKIGRITEPYNK